MWFSLQRDDINREFIGVGKGTRKERQRVANLVTNDVHGDKSCLEEVHKAEDDVWIAFPWEQGWGINYEEQYQ